MKPEKRKELSVILQQLMNHAGIYQYYCKHWQDEINVPTNITYCFKQGFSNMDALIDKVCRAINAPELKSFVKQQLHDEDRLNDIAAINEIISGLDNEALAKVREKIELVILPIVNFDHENSSTI
jgi:hypothetical protein